MSKLSAHQKRARDFIQREDWAQALSELLHVLEADAANPTLHNQVGDVYLRRDDVQKACEHFERAVELYAGVGLHNSAVALCKKVLRLTPAEGLTAATLNAAAAVGRADRLGSVEPGKRCDLVVTEAADYREVPFHFGVNNVRAVIAGGRLVWDADGTDR